MVNADLVEDEGRWLRRIFAIVFLPIILIGACVISEIPLTVTSFRQFGNYPNGKRVEFIGTFKGTSQERSSFAFDGETISVMANLYGERSLKMGGRYWVIGNLRRDEPLSRVTIMDAKLRFVSME